MLGRAAEKLKCDDPEVQSIVESGTASVEWVRQEFTGVRLGDERLDKRLIKTAEFLAKSPQSPINEACRTWKDTKAAYRLFDNPKAVVRAMLAPHIEATRTRVEQIEGWVLSIQDTVFFSYGQHPNTKGLGPIGKSNEAHERGLIMHNAIAFTTSGVPLGILSQQIWAREAVSEDEEPQEKIERLQVTPIEEKESFKWLQGLRETHERVPGKSQLITVADRESDLWEFLTEAKESGQHFLIRARTDRQLVPEDSECYEKMAEALAHAPLLGRKAVGIPGNSKRKTRTAEVAVRVRELTIKAPQRRGRAKASASSQEIMVTAISVLEPQAPEGEEAIAWVLLTDLVVRNFDSACEKIDWYGKRFSIETWHKVLKSGCQVEKCLLEHADRLKRYLTLFSIIGVRLMHVAYLAREQPDLPASQVFSKDEIEAVYVQTENTRIPVKSPTVKDVVRRIGSLGGHLGRKHDKEPGMTVFWRGWMRMYETVLALRNFKTLFNLRDTS